MELKQIYFKNLNKIATITQFSLHSFCFYLKIVLSWIRIQEGK